MRMSNLLALLLPLALCLACNPEYPPPAELPAEYTACDAPDDCTVVELGCCDECNGGTARSVATEHAATVAERYAEGCAPGQGCNEMGCAPWATTCEDNVCGLRRTEF